MATVSETFARALQHHQKGDLGQAERLYREVIRCEPRHADSHHLLGVLSYQCGQFESAAAWFQHAVSIKPSAADFQSNLGLALASSGRLTDAVACFREALRLQPQLADTHSNLGNVLVRLNKSEEARRHYEEALRLNPDSAEAHCGLGVILSGENNFSESTAHFEEAVRINPFYAEAHNNLANALHFQGRSQDAIAHCKQALRHRPDFAEAHLSLGNILLAVENERDAEACFREVVRIAPTSLEAQNALGNALERQGRIAEAKSSFEQVLSHHPDNSEAHNGLGNVFTRLDQLDQALKCYRQALRLKNRFPAACNNLGCLLVRRGQLNKAIAVFRQALRLQPIFPEVQSNLGDALRQQEKFPEAVQELQRVLEIKPDYAAAHFNLGLALASLGKTAEATKAFKQALQFDPDSAETHTQLANMAMETSSFDEAVAHYERAVFLKPDYGEAHVNMAVVLAEQGYIARAETHFNHALRWWPSAKVRIKHAIMLPPLYQTLDELQYWRQRLTEQLRLLRDENVTLDVTKDPATNVFYLSYQGMNDRDLLEQVSRLYVPPNEYTRRLKHARGFNKIKVGMISHCFRHHSVGFWMRGLTAQLDRTDFEVTVLSIGSFDDNIADFFRKHSDRFLEVPRNLPAARRLIADQKFDVLIYTDIGMDSQSYTLAMSRLAPVQCATVGHPVTSGLKTIDYYISSCDLETEGCEQCYTEKLVRLKNLPIYYFRPKAPPGTKRREHFGLAKDAHVYACLQSLFKFHPEFDSILGGILRSDVRAVLLLSSVKITAWESLLRQRLKVTLPDVMDRIRFLPLMDFLSYLDLLACADVQLDPIHFGGGSTSYDALSIGLPIVTMPSRYMRGRFTSAFYKQICVLDCVARDPDDYVKNALRLGTDVDYRGMIRDKILAANHALFENSDGIREMEHFLKQAVEASEHD